MLVSWGLTALLLGVSAAAWPFASSRHAATSPPARLEAIGLDIFNSTELDGFVEDFKLRHVLPPRVPAKVVKLDPEWTAISRVRRSQARLLQSREDECSPSAPVVCAGAGGSGPVCNGCSTCCPDGNGGFQCCAQGFKCCVAANGAGSCCPINGGTCGSGGCSLPPTTPTGVSTVFATTTVTHTVTVSDARTTAIVSTITQTITVVDPQKQTETDTVTVTSFQGVARRTVTAQEARSTFHVQARRELGGASTPTVTLDRFKGYDPLEAQLAGLGVKVVRGVDADAGRSTITSTITIDVTTTITVGIVTSTRFDTVFATVTVAPNAVTTVFTTTTIFLPGTGPTGGTTSLPPPPPPPPAPTTTTTTNPNPPPSTPTTSQPASPTPTSGRGTTATPLPPNTSPSSGIPTSSPNPSSSSGVPTSAPPPSTSSPNTLTTTPENPTTASGTIGTLSSATPTIVTPTPTPPALPFSDSRLSSDQIAGIALGAIFGLFALIVAAWLARRYVQRRRSDLASQRQQLTPPSGITSGPVSSVPPGLVARGVTAAAVDPNEVRIVIQPAPKGGRPRRPAQRFPVPPGHAGPTVSMYIEGTTGETTPHERDWSVESEFGGSLPSPEPSGPATRRQSGVPSSGIFSTEMQEPEFRVSIPDIPDGQSTEYTEGRPSISSSAPATRLQPPPPLYGSGRGGLASPASPGVGRAM